MVNKFFIYVLSFLFISIDGNAQKEFKTDKYRNAHVENENSTAQFRVTNNHTKKNINNIYFWYDNKTIHDTKGSYSGYLLDGDYKEFVYPKNDLVRAGKFKNGLKNGKWIEWADNTTIKETSTWKNGQLNGRRVYYKSDGSVHKTEIYRNGVCKDCVPKKKSFKEHWRQILSKYNIGNKK